MVMITVLKERKKNYGLYIISGITIAAGLIIAGLMVNREIDS